LIFNRLIKLCLLITLCNYTSSTLYANHIVGGELTYECIDANEGLYTIKLALYRDCLCKENSDCPEFDGVANITIFNNGQKLGEELTLLARKEIKPNIEGLCLETVPDLCIEASVGYEKVIKLPPSPFEYIIVYQRCCRNTTIVNIENPSQTGSTYQITIPPTNVAVCNNSPVFNNYPPIVICTGFPIEFDYSATDIDGDSLVYELCNPLKGAPNTNPNPVEADYPPYTSVDWVDNFSVENQMGSDPQVKVNPVTGYLEGTPLRAGQYIMGICVKEYRNGRLLGTMARDFQFNVADCGIVKAEIKADEVKDDGTFVIQECEKYNIDFLNESIGAENYTWNFGDPGTYNDFSFDKNPSYEYVDAGKYLVQLIADPNETCTDTAYIEINMYPTQKPDFTWAGGCADEPVQFTDISQTDFGTITNWQWFFGSNSSSTLQNPIVELDNTSDIDVKLRVTTDLGCVQIITKTIDLDIVPIPQMEHSKLCLSNQPIEFRSISTISSGTITAWKWMVYDEYPNEIYNTVTKDLLYTFEDAGTYIVKLEVTGNNGCSNSIDTSITLFEQLEIDAGQDIFICENTSFEINLNTGSDIDYFEWSPFNEAITTYNGREEPVIQPQNSETYSVTAYDFNGCSATDTFEVSLYKVPELSIGNDTLICDNSTVFLQPKIQTAYNGELSYYWHNNLFINDANQFNQFVTLDTSSTFYFTVTESTHNCTITDSIFIKVDKPVIPYVVNDTIVCPGSVVKLAASGGDTYNWYNNSQQLVAQTAETEIIANENNQYSVTIANSCYSTEAKVTIEVFDLPPIEAGDNVEIDIGESLLLNPVFDDYDITNFYWTSDKDYLTTDSEKSVTITPFEDSWYVLNAITNNNCLITDTVNVVVKVEPNILIPNAFSPNGDGLNDVIVPILKGVKHINTFAVYNRYGERVFQTNNSEVSWNGIYKNEPLTMGVYVYFVQGITFFDQPFSKKGNITLVK